MMFAKAPRPDVGEGGTELDAAVAPALGIEQGFLDLFESELLVLQTCLVRSDTFEHQVLVFFWEASRSHGTLRHLPEDGEATVGDEDSLSTLQWSGLNKCETAGEEGLVGT